MSLKRRITSLEDDRAGRRRPVPAIVMDEKIPHRGEEITPAELEELPTNSQGIRAVDFRAPDSDEPSSSQASTDQPTH